MLQQLPNFSRSALREALSELAQHLPSESPGVDLSLYGPACLLAAGISNNPISVIDAVAVERQDLIDQAATQLANVHRWPHGWITDRFRIHLNRRVEIPANHRLMVRLPPALHR